MIRASGANVVLVGFGNPDQEMWIARHCRELEVPLIIGVGALLDFLAGAVPQAPGWMQRARLEWAYRLLREPRRLWKRYLWFTPLLILQSIAERGRARWLSVVAAFLLMDVELVTSSE